MIEDSRYSENGVISRYAEDASDHGESAISDVALFPTMKSLKPEGGEK